jgi:biopolymer transport protein ExbD
MSQYRWVKRKRPEINIIPLVDVLTTLIFFFLLTMSFQDVSSLQITLPQIQTASAGKTAESLRIGITSDGVFYLNEVQVSESELQRTLQEIAALDHRQQILILSDEEGLVKNLTRVMDLCREAGFDRFRILSR